QRPARTCCRFLQCSSRPGMSPAQLPSAETISPTRTAGGRGDQLWSEPKPTWKEGRSESTKAFLVGGRLLAKGDSMFSWRVISIGLTAVALVLGAVPDLTLAHPRTPETEVELEGTLEILHEDLPGGGRFNYFLHSGGVRYSLHFDRNRPEHLRTGATIRVKGAKVDNTLALGDGKKVKPVTPAPTPSTLGAQRVLVFLVNFEDDPAEPYTAAD